MSIAIISSRGQITIPAEIRALLSLNKGDKINFIIDGNEVKFIPVTKDIRSIKGIIKKPLKPVTIEEMNKTIKAKGGQK
ncbi:MAG: AbrB/MazE/SpoVT family DNA-binding domain-containing protein [Gammaproteobacteria bacterium]|jgi:AbrB family looped-hinge helix DNA binding protein|nr:AbrB/MazE/SpoVT family DNA-binding domain-containing protein [Xanthomonadales bacterium]MCB1604893.1 AbrB/MazE/SpoVT family DNA-binding domain-containing protein [Xanthomonadales bacterium]HOP23254.1 AbrB/MazE/SpoVT family DNA-binding domain-containing protein [Gammaproteobacteria bacterium]